MSAHNAPAVADELVRQAKTGDSGAFAELVAPLSRRMLSIAHRLVGNREDAEDVVQESLWKAYQHLPSYRMEAAFSSWLTRITVNQAIGLLRRRRTNPIDQSLDSDDQTQPVFACWPAPGPTPEEICQVGELRDRLATAMERIPLKYQVALSQLALEGRSHREIADRLGVSVATAKTRVHRARHMLRRILSQQGRMGDYLKVSEGQQQ